MTFYVEWAISVKDRCGRMVSGPALERLLKLPDPGYSSVYHFEEKDALEIRARENSRGLNQYAVGASYLVVDCDSGEEGRLQIEAALASHGLAYEIWSSGGKGYHFYIPHDFIFDKRLPESHKQAALALFPKEHIDLTLYQHGRLLSLPGRVHPVTKQKKKLITKIEGAKIEFPLVDPPKSLASFITAQSDSELLAMALQRSYDLICFPPDKGTRHIRLWGTATDFATAGLDYETTVGLLTRISETWEEPKTAEEIEKVVSSAYKRNQ